MARRKPSQLELVLGCTPAQISTQHRFRLNEQWVEYTLKRSQRRRSISLTIDEDGLRVGAPWRASQRRIESLLVSHARWIVRKLAEWRTRRPPPFIWQADAPVMMLGEPLMLAPDLKRGATERDGDRLYIAADANNPDTLAHHVIAWLRATAQGWFEQRAAHYAPLIGVQVSAIRLSNAKTRWGTCHPDGRIHLNWKLIQMPPDLIDYVVVHELAHLREPNHSRRFWHWVANVLPDYEQRRQTLRREGHRYLLANV
jgi:predicted metal-dependent hydrolase